MFAWIVSRSAEADVAARLCLLAGQRKCHRFGLAFVSRSTVLSAQRRDTPHALPAAIAIAATIMTATSRPSNALLPAAVAWMEDDLIGGDGRGVGRSPASRIRGLRAAGPVPITSAGLSPRRSPSPGSSGKTLTDSDVYQLLDVTPGPRPRRVGASPRRARRPPRRPAGCGPRPMRFSASVMSAWNEDAPLREMRLSTSTPRPAARQCWPGRATRPGSSRARGPRRSERAEANATTIQIAETASATVATSSPRLIRRWVRRVSQRWDRNSTYAMAMATRAHDDQRQAGRLGAGRGQRGVLLRVAVARGRQQREVHLLGGHLDERSAGQQVAEGAVGLSPLHVPGVDRQPGRDRGQAATSCGLPTCRRSAAWPDRRRPWRCRRRTAGGRGSRRSAGPGTRSSP